VQNIFHTENSRNIFSERNLLVTFWSRPEAIYHITCQLVGLTVFCYVHCLVLPIFEFRFENGYILLQKFTVFRKLVIYCNLKNIRAKIKQISSLSRNFFPRNLLSGFLYVCFIFRVRNSKKIKTKKLK